MKKPLLLLLLSFLVVGSFAQIMTSPIQNNGFENWNVSYFSDPLYYQTSNDQGFAKGQLTSPNVYISSFSHSGNDAIQLITVQNGSNIVGGFFANGDPSNASGGIPYTDRPTALTGYYTSNIQTGDTALVLVIFKSQGQVISQNMLKLTGYVNTYTAFSLPISFFSSATPDSVIIGATSSNLLNGNGIPGSTITYDDFAFTGVNEQPTQLNGGFEAWVNHSITTPYNWFTSDSTFQTTDSHSGQYAIMTKSELQQPGHGGNNSSPINPGSVSTGQWINTSANTGYYRGQPDSLKTDTLVGWYKYFPSGVDTAYAMISLSKNGVQLGYGAFVPLVAASNYTFFKLPYQSSIAPDSVTVTFSSSKWDATVANAGSTLYLDDVYFTSQFLHINVATNNVQCYNTASGSANVTIKGGNATGFEFLYTDNGASYLQTYLPNLTSLAAGTYSLTVTDANSVTATTTFEITQPNALMANVSTTSTGCQNATGTAMVTPSGGTSAYTATWSNTASGVSISSLSAGAYTVTVTDANSCSVSTVALVNNTGAATLVPTIQNVLCNGNATGSVTIMPTGGTPVFSYAWSNDSTNASMSNLSAGNYYVTVTDAASCISLTEVTITEPSAINAFLYFANPTCASSKDAYIVAQVTGGNVGVGYIYNWSGSTIATDSIYAIGAGTYTVTITDANACQITATQTITAPQPVTANFFTLSNLACYGDSTTLFAIANGGSFNYSYSWGANLGTASSVSNVKAGTYTLTVTDDNGCFGVATTTINQPAQLQVTVGSSTDSVYAIANGGIPAYNYTWAFGSSSISHNGISAGVYDTIANIILGSTYTVTVSDLNGCLVSGTTSLTTNGILNASTKTQLTVYPNPTASQIFVATGTEVATKVEIADVLGNSVMTVVPNAYTTSLDIHALKSGIYFVRVQLKGGMQTMSIVKQ